MAAPPPHRLNDSRSSSWITTTPNRNPAGSSEQFSSALLAPDQAELARASSDQPRQRNTCKQLIRHKQLRSQIVIIPILSFFVDIVFYGILFGLKSLKGNIYVNGLMVGCADLCAGISLAFLSNIIGRKGLIRVTWAVCGISCLVYNEIKDNQVAEYITVLLGKYGATCSFSLMFLISSETFPTAIRGKMVGICNACARVGGAVAPLINGYLGANMMYFFGGLSVAAFLLAFGLRETKNQLIQDDLEEMPRLEFKTKG